MITKRINRINPSATLEMTSKAVELRNAGKTVLNLSVGEPDFETPINIKKAAIEAIQNGHTRYTPGSGILSLKKAISEKMNRDNNLNFDINEIIVSCGGKHSLYNACQVLFEKGDEVIIFSPYWVSFPDFISVTGAKPIFVATNPEKQFEPIFKELKKKISSKTKGIIINSPSNPTGGLWSNDAIKKVIEIAKKNNIWVFSDECYEQLTYDKKFTSIATLDKKYNKILTFQSCSKTYAMTGWRIGYTAGNKDVIQAMSKLQGQSTSCPNSIAQYAAVEALTGDQSIVLKMKNSFKIRRDLMVNRLNNIKGISCLIPGGAFYAFPNFKNYIGKSLNNTKIKSATQITMYLLEKKYVVSVPGKEFGSPNNIRFSYAISEKDINIAMNSLEEVLNKIK